MSHAGSLARRRRLLVPVAAGVLLPVLIWGAGSWEEFLRGGKSRAGRHAASVLVVDDSRGGLGATHQSHNSGQAALAAGVTAVLSPVGAAPAEEALPPDPIVEAIQIMTSCRQAYQSVTDYTCTFSRRERMDDGTVVGPHVMSMKVLAQPVSIYFKFLQPFAGREAIWTAAANDGKLLVHEGGMARLLAGTLKLDPTSGLAMQGCRHPISEAGVGYLIEQVLGRWQIELTPGESLVTILRDARVGDRSCTLIEAKHPQKHDGFVHHKVKLYIDNEHNLPIRFEAYGWPGADGESELIEEYTYVDLKLNVGLSNNDFDPANSSYAFSRF